MGLPAIPTRHADSAAHRQRISETVNGITSFQHDDSRVRTSAEISAGVTPVNYAYAPLDLRRYGYSADGSTASSAINTAALNSAISVAATANGGATGATITIPTGIAYIDSTITLPNRVRLKGANCSGSIIRAVAAFSTPSVAFMFHAHNGTIAMFDSILEDLFIDCNDVAGLSGVLSYAWQENSGMRNVTIFKFRVYGVQFQHGYGGASTCELKQVQFFPSSVHGATACIKLDTLSSVGAFLLHVRDSVLAGDANGTPCDRGVDLDEASLLLQNCHFEGCTDGVYADGPGSCTLINVTGIAGMTNLVHVAATFTGRLQMLGCFRNGSPMNFVNNEASGEAIAYDLTSYVYPDVSSQNTAKAWGVFDGTVAGTNAPTKGYNVASVQRTGAGRYTITLTNAVLNANMAVVMSTNLGTANKVEWVSLVGTTTFTLSINVAGVATDSNEIKFIAFGL